MADVLTRRKSLANEMELIRLAVRGSLFSFAKVVLGYELLSEGFHRPICDWLNKTEAPRRLVLVPRGYFKTALLTEARTVWRILRNPEARHLLASIKAEQAEDMLRPIKAHLTNERLVAAFPDVLYRDPDKEAEQWSAGQITVKRKKNPKEATVETIGVSGEKTGKHYDFGIFDDVVGQDNSRTRDERLKVINWYQDIQPLFDPGAQQDFNATPWHVDDLSGWLQEQAKAGRRVAVYKRPCWDEVAAGSAGATPLASRDGAWVIAQSPAELAVARWVRPTFPERFPVPVLLEKRSDASHDAAKFAAQYLINPVDSSTAYFPRTAIKSQVVPRSELLKFPLALGMTADPAISLKGWADYSALVVGGWKPNGDLCILDIQRGRWDDTTLVARVYALWDRYRPPIVGFEANGFQRTYKRLFVLEGEKRGNRFIPIVGLERTTKQGVKNDYIRTLKPMWDGGSIWIAQECQALEEFIEEAERFRPGSESAHDDMLDAVADLIQLRFQPMDGTANDIQARRSMNPDGWAIADMEEQIQQEREGRQMARLDRGSMRAAVMQRRRRDDMAIAWARMERHDAEFWG